MSDVSDSPAYGEGVVGDETARGPCSVCRGTGGGAIPCTACGGTGWTNLTAAWRVPVGRLDGQVVGVEGSVIASGLAPQEEQVMLAGFLDNRHLRPKCLDSSGPTATLSLVPRAQV